MGKLTLLSALLSTVVVVSSLTPTDNSTLQGFTPESLTILDNAMHKWADKEGRPIVTLLARNGQIVHHDAYGTDHTRKVAKDSIFNLMSMTKPISGIAMMTFFEEGKFALDDPVSKHIPKFGDLKVGGTVPQKTPMTMSQLLSHSAGFPDKMANYGPTLKAWVEALDKLAFQPGTAWKYGPGVEIQGYLMEKWAGKDISDILQERLLKPLGMVDTGFWTPDEKQPRVVSSLSKPPRTKPKLLIPSYGLHSTAEDYWRFCQMVINGGEFNGTRYLKPETIKLMQQNVLDMDHGVFVDFMGGGRGIGFGLDFAVVVDPKKPTREGGEQHMPKGSFFWGGAFGTWFWIDPMNNVVFIGLVNKAGGGLGGDVTLRQASAKAIYDGLRS